MKQTIEIGYHERQLVTIEVTLKDGRFAASGNYWRPNMSDINRGGQCLDEILIDFPENQLVRDIHKVWKKYHLNDLTAGSPTQEKVVKEYLEDGKRYDYTEVSEHLRSIGLNPDKSYLHKGKPYKYGYAWLKRDIPAQIISEIKSWGKPTK